MISVVIPMYNSEDTILRCIESVVKQDFKGNTEIIIVNDGSKDHSLEIVRNYIDENPGVKLILVDKPNGGVSSARNEGIKKSTGDYIAFLDSDDEWFPNKLSTQMKVLQSAPEKIDFLASAFDGLYLKNREEGALVKIELKDLIYKNYFQPSTVIMKKEIVDKVGYFDENQKYAEEGNYFIRISRHYNCYFLNTKVINYGDGKSGFGVSGLSSNIKEMQKGFQKNIKYAYDNNYITYLQYLSASLFSKLKYLRRVLIVNLRK